MERRTPERPRAGLLQSPIGKVCVTRWPIIWGQEWIKSPSKWMTPRDYWVTRMDHWQELSQYATGMPSERAFSALGSFVTDKRVRLSTDTVDRLIFFAIKSFLDQQQLPSPLGRFC